MRHQQPTRDVLTLAAFLGASYAAAAIGSRWTLPAIPTWYRSLHKPAWTPPDRVFGPVWTALYTAMGVSAWRVSRTDSRGRAPLLAWSAQLALNVAWSGVFFGRRSPGAGVGVIACLWLAILATIVLSARVSRAGAALLLPYLAWTSFAAALNVRIWTLNRRTRLLPVGGK
jgi:tryptophan-rich sensory protein